MENKKCNIKFFEIEKFKEIEVSNLKEAINNMQKERSDLIIKLNEQKKRIDA